METQKKVVELGESCFVCARIVPKKEKVYMFGETLIDFCAIISSALNVDVRNYSASSGQLFNCRAECCKRLTKFKRALDNFREAKREVETVYKRKNPGTKRSRSEEDLEIVEVIDKQQTTLRCGK